MQNYQPIMKNENQGTAPSTSQPTTLSESSLPHGLPQHIVLSASVLRQIFQAPSSYTASNSLSQIMTNERQVPRTVTPTATSAKRTRQTIKLNRLRLFILIRILFQYLQKVDPQLLHLAKEVLKDCERKHKSNESKYGSLAEAINDRLRDVVGEAHWAEARRIQSRLMVNHRRRKTVKFGLVGLGGRCTL